MKREDLIKNWNVVEAFKNGEEIEMFDDRVLKKWVICESPSFYSGIEYRVRPKTEYVPFDFSDAAFLIGSCVFCKDLNSFGVITEVAKNYIVVYNDKYEYEYFYKKFTFADGTPCGKLKTK